MSLIERPKPSLMVLMVTLMHDISHMFKREGRVVFVALILAVVVIGAQRAWEFIGEIDGALNPVVTSVQLYDPQRGQFGASTVYKATAIKKRDCREWLGIKWFARLPSGASVPVAAEFLDKPQERATGFLQWNALRLAVAPEQIKETYGYVYHDCGFGPAVRTMFYNGEPVKGAEE